MFLSFQTYLSLLPSATQEYPSIVTYTPLSPLLPPLSVSNHVPPSFVSINLYDTRLHLSNVSGLDRIPVQKFLIKPVLCVYRWTNYNLTGLIKQQRQEKADRSMCYDPHLFHPSPSPPELISLHPHILISAYFLPQRVWRRNGRGWEDERHGGLATPVGLGSVPSARLPVLNSHVIRLTNLGKYHSAYLLLISDYEDS